MKLDKVIAIPAVALAAGLSLVACGSQSAAPVAKPAAAHTVTANPATAEPASAKTTPAAAVPAPAAAAAAILSVRGFSGTSPGEVDFSGDATYIVTNITWNWGASEASGTGTSDIQGCDPSCATGSETPYTDTIVLSDVQGGQFTRVSSTRDGTVTSGSTSLILGAEQTSGNSSSSVPAPATPSRTDCGDGVYAGPNTSCSFAANVAQNYTGPGADHASSPVTGQDYTMNCTESAGTVTCTGGNNASVQFSG
ncbi:MAG: hypothetical protein ACLPQY_09550 [Streptosporangiaceae bacterium]